uniref:Ribosomal protein S2 n=1 Tax=Spumella sp. NIES-1846 TaxID=2490549 RepID=A0A455RGJ5_9STRA|nr:ribosomal protein S2 [Spumella sp. NIES-1846]
MNIIQSELSILHNSNILPHSFKNINDYSYINIEHTIKFLYAAGQYIQQIGNKDSKILFIGTTKLAEILYKNIFYSLNSYYLNFRWLNGTLTNWFMLQTQLQKYQYLKSKYCKFLHIKSNKKFMKKYKRYHKFYSGIENMTTLPDMVFILASYKNHIPILECKTLNIPTFSFLNSTGNPIKVTCPIPCNITSITILSYILKYLLKQGNII